MNWKHLDATNDDFASESNCSVIMIFVNVGQ